MSETSTFNPNWASAPGRTISDLISEKKLSIGLFASKISHTEKFVDELLSGRQTITPDLAVQLQKVIGGSVEFWITRENQYREDLEKLSTQELSNWIDSVPLNDMLKLKWISKPVNKVKTALDFFGVDDLNTWKNKYSAIVRNASFRKSSAFRSDIVSIAAWLRQGELVASKVNCKPWNAEKFGAALLELKRLTRNKNPKDFLPQLVKECAECGVAVAIVRTPSGCPASGATNFIKHDKAMLLLSFRYLSDDQFWFTFFHEAGHLLLHSDQNTIIEGYAEDQRRENEANTFAADVLIAPALQQKLRSLKRTKREIISFAMLAGVSPGIVIGQMQHFGYADPKNLNYYKRRYDEADLFG